METMTAPAPSGFENDIPTAAGYAAYSGISFSPERRAEQTRAEYAGTLAADLENLEKLATTDEKRATLAEEFARYREGYRRRYLIWLSAKSRCLSTMITGPSNFPVARNEKRNRTEDRRFTDLKEYRERALKAIRRELCPEDRPIMAGDADAVARLGDKLKGLEERQARYKAINAAHIKFLKNPASLDALTLSEEEKALIRRYVPPYSWEPHPIAPFQFSNLSAQIRNERARLGALERNKAQAPQEIQGEAARYEDSPAENRVRLFFPGKPAREVIDRLKKCGFRWTPSLGCWQAYRTALNSHREEIKTMAGIA